MRWARPGSYYVAAGTSRKALPSDPKGTSVTYLSAGNEWVLLQLALCRLVMYGTSAALSAFAKGHLEPRTPRTGWALQRPKG